MPRGWINLLVVLLIFVGPMLVKVIQSIIEKAEEKKKQNQQTQSFGRGADESVRDRQMKQAQQKADLAAKRRAELEKWREEQQARQGQASVSSHRAIRPPSMTPVSGSSGAEEWAAAVVSEQESIRRQRRARIERMRGSANTGQQVRQANVPGGQAATPTSTPTRPTRSSRGGRVGRRAVRPVHQMQPQQPHWEHEESTVHRLVADEPAEDTTRQVRQVMKVDSGRIGDLLSSRASIRNAVILKEILDRPIAMRERWPEI